MSISWRKWSPREEPTASVPLTKKLLYSNSFSKAVELLALLMKHGADVFAKDSLGENALHWLPVSRVKEPAELARAFIEMGVPLDQASSFGYQPIHWAVYWEKIDLVRLYLDHGAEVNTRTDFGASPLYFAAERKNLEVLKILLDRGANVHSKTIAGQTALHEACRNLHKECIELLLSAGADVLLEDLVGYTPFALAVPHLNAKHPSVRLMLRAIALKKVCLQPSIESKDERLIKQHPELWDYYRDCHAHISRMKFTRFIESCSFLDLLVKNCCQIASLMRNPDFEANFELYDLSGFSMYAEDVRRAFERAQDYYQSMLEQENVVSYMFF